MTGLVTQAKALSEREARSLTDEVKADAHSLWEKCLRLYEGQAHKALGYSSWGAFWTEEFGGRKSHGYRLLSAAKVVAALPNSPNGERPNEAQARELAPLKGKPEKLAEAWRAISDNGKPTAAKAREALGAQRETPSVAAFAKECGRFAATAEALLPAAPAAVLDADVGIPDEWRDAFCGLRDCLDQLVEAMYDANRGESGESAQ